MFTGNSSKTNRLPVFICWVLLFYFLQSYYKYHFFYIEQNQLFLFQSSFISDILNKPGGFCQLISDFIIQFYAYPYVGALITTILLITIGVLSYRIIFGIIPKSTGILLFLIPVILFIFPHLNVNYSMDGTIAYILMLLSFIIFLRITHHRWKLGFVFIWLPVLFWLAGSIAFLYIIVICVYQLLKDFRNSYLFAITLAEAVFIGSGSVYLGFLPNTRTAFLPDFYFHPLLPTPGILYWIWASTPLMICAAFAIGGFKKKTLLITRITLIGIQVIIALVLWRACLIKYGDYKSIQYKKTDYLARHEQWGEIIKTSNGKINNSLILCNLNMALANKNDLGNCMFHFDQKGINGLLITWDRKLQTAYLLSDLYFTTGNIAASQQIAFEGYVISKNGSPRFLQRLVQTNIITGSYSIAEKYINILENTFCYRDWAKKHRKFLFNDDVEKDSLLNMKRKSLLKKNYLYTSSNVVTELSDLAENNPEYTVPIEYLGATFLLLKDLEAFAKIINTYYATEVLKDLPQSFQQAIYLIYNDDTDNLKRFNMDSNILKEYNGFIEFMLLNKDNPNLVSLAYNKYGYTYWFYYFFR